MLAVAGRHWMVVALALCGPISARAHQSASEAALSEGPQFASEAASSDTRRVLQWVLSSGDNVKLPFIIVDKLQAKVYVFNAGGELLGATPALLGRARGDDSAPGIGSRRLATIRADERTTPAGRFVAFMGRDFEHDLLWIDYEISLSLHRVIKGDPGDHRLQRLASASPQDRRISYGCINVPVGFYERIVLKTFAGTRGIVYILPEVKAVEDFFPVALYQAGEGSSKVRSAGN